MYNVVLTLKMKASSNNHMHNKSHNRNFRREKSINTCRQNEVPWRLGSEEEEDKTNVNRTRDTHMALCALHERAVIIKAPLLMHK